MSERLFESVQTHLGVETEGRPAQAASDTPFRILLIGDYSGRAHRGANDARRVANTRPQLIDRDDFEDVMRKLGAQLQLRLSGVDSSMININIASLEDFHPDAIYEKLDIFNALRSTRQKLADPKSFASAKAEINAWAGKEAAGASVSPAPAPASPTATTVDAAGVLDQMLIGAAARAAPEAINERSWNALLRQIVAPHVIPAADPMQAELTACVDTAVSVMMRAILHDPAFQALEAAWRALALAVRGIDTGTQLKLYLLDASKEEFIAALAGDESPWRKLLIDDADDKFGDEGWALTAANYHFSDDESDIGALALAAAIAQEAAVPLVAGANASLLGCKSLAQTPRPEDWREPLVCHETWTALREAPCAHYLALALPRLLLRMPYGKKADAVERFAFEEAGGDWQHEHYLWGNPAIACAILLARTFSTSGWDFASNLERDIEGLPMHIYRDNGEDTIKPCAEIALSEKAASRMLECGVMPFASIKNEDRVRLVRLQSIASNGGALLGRWR